MLVTGSDGFIGKNLCATLEQDQDLEIIRYDVNNKIEELAGFIAQADFIFHLAGVNRPQKVEEFAEGNQKLTEVLFQTLKQTGRKTPVAITSLMQAALDNPYGVSKKAAEEIAFEHSKGTGVPVYVYRLPNVFGKWSRPNYNSVVATFCYNIARGLSIQINDPAKEITLVYIDDVVRELVGAMEGQAKIDEGGFCYVPRTYKVTLRKLAETINEFAKSRKNLAIPNFEDDFKESLYATYTSYLPESEFGYNLEMKHDNRGWLAEFVKSREAGQIFISRTKPGITRGNHWHHTKTEKFLVVEGETIIKFRKIGSDEIIEYKVSGDELKVVDIPTGYTHSITNIGKSDLITLFWADRIFDPENPNTYYLEV